MIEIVHRRGVDIARDVHVSRKRRRLTDPRRCHNCKKEV